jgi:hypothetical protein
MQLDAEEPPASPALAKLPAEPPKVTAVVLTTTPAELSHTTTATQLPDVVGVVKEREDPAPDLDWTIAIVI